VTKPEIDAVREWLDKEGYPLEFEAAREIKRAGFDAWQGRYYEDTEAKTHREIDVSAQEPESTHNGNWRPVFVVVECKNNSKPWLVLTTTLTLDAGFGTRFLIARGVGPNELSLETAIPGPGFLTNVPERHGYSVVQTIAGADSGYGAMQSVVKASIDTVSDFTNRQPALAIPVIVLGGSLYQLGFRDDGTEILEAVLWQRVIWFGSSAARDSVQIDVVTKNYLPAYLRQLRPATKALAAALGNLKR
jgi:hypothetical protein